TAAGRPGDSSKLARRLPGRRYDRFFFSGMALLSLITVFVGFSRTYYLAGLFRAPLPSPIIHVHGAAFSCWIVLLVVQTFPQVGWRATGATRHFTLFRKLFQGNFPQPRQYCCLPFIPVRVGICFGC